MKTEKTAALVIREGDKFLLTKRAISPLNGFWCIPGGHVDERETLEEAALREGEEEVGEVELGSKITVWAHDVGIGHRHEAHFFFAALKGDVTINEESSEFGFFSVEEMKKLALTDWTLYVFNYMLEKKII